MVCPIIRGNGTVRGIFSVPLPTLRWSTHGYIRNLKKIYMLAILVYRTGVILPGDGVSIMAEMTQDQKKERIIFLRKEKQKLDDENKKLSGEELRLNKIRKTAIAEGQTLPPGSMNQIDKIAITIKQNNKKLAEILTELNTLTENGKYPLGEKLSRSPPRPRD
jgi:hypothetical protein